MARTRVTLTVSLPYDMIDYVNDVAEAEKLNFSQAVTTVLQRGKAYLAMLNSQKEEE